MYRQIEKSISLKPYNGMAVEAKADFFIQATTIEDITTAVRFAQDKALPILVLGEGSNTLFTKDYSGLVILNKLKGVEHIGQDDMFYSIRAAAGENWHEFVKSCIESSAFGLENLALIPGTIGAAPIQNIGAYGVEVASFIDTIEWYDFETGEVAELTNAQCEFHYRNSVFKNQLKDKGIILSVTFRLLKQENLNLSYPQIANAFEKIDEVTAEQLFTHICSIRQAKLPHPKQIPNLGSFFKNPIVSEEKLESLKSAFPDIVYFPFENSYKLAAAWLIDQLGWKQKEYKQIKLASNQALVITNPKQANGRNVLDFARKIQDDVFRQYQVALEIEPVVVC